MKKLVSSVVLFLSIGIFSIVYALPPKIAIGIDTSGSMQNREVEMRDFIKMLRKNLKVPYDMYVFSDQTKKIRDENEIEIGGGTAPSTFFKAVLDNKRGLPKAVILITDGFPNPSDEPIAVKLAEKLKKKNVKICAAFLDENMKKNEPPFLKKISDVRIYKNTLKEALKECIETKALRSLKLKEDFINFDLNKFLDENKPF